MSDPLSTTFQSLLSSRNQTAIDTLVAALDVGVDTIRIAALSALLKRQSPRGQVEVVRRFATLSPEMQTLVQNDVREMETAIRQCLIHGEKELLTNALELVRTSEYFEQLSTILEMIDDRPDESGDLALRTFRDLVNRLYEQICPPENKSSTLHDASQVRQHVLANLENACGDYPSLAHPEDVVLAILVLGDIDSPAVKAVLWQASPECRQMAGSLLLSSTHPGVMQLICDSMSQNYPHAKSFEAIKRRTDPEFIYHLLRWFPEQLSTVQQANFRQIDSVAWLDRRASMVNLIPPGLQKPLVSFISATGLSNEEKSTIREWLVRNGSPDARCAASDVLASLADNDARNVILESLEAGDPKIQAWATSQLRAQGIPEAYSLLVERLKSPVSDVRDAARAELEGFNLDRMLSLFDHLDAETCLRAGQVLRKTDPDCIDKLRREMANPVRRKRIQAAKAAQAMGLQNEVTSAYLAMLQDSESFVRRIVVEILGTIPTRDSVLALQDILNDPSPRVREAANKSLQHIRGQQTQQRRQQDSGESVSPLRE